MPRYLAISIPEWLQNPAWLVTAALFVLLIFRDVAKDLLSQAIERSALFLYDLIGTRLLRKRAVRRYSRTIREKYGRVNIPFLEGRALAMQDVYVPIKAVNVGDSEVSSEAYESLRAAGTAVITGPPGSGKSMLLRHSVLLWALGDGKSRLARVPVLLDLHRCNGDETTTLEQHLTAQLGRDGLPSPARFLSHLLKTRRLSVLLDGLDEVGSRDRTRVVGWIKDFVEANEGCQVLVTCRSAIYEGQLSPQISQGYRVADFDQQLIRRFLRGWPGMPGGQAVDQLLGALRNTPRLLQLAKNPLLLTMIAYLYSDVYDGKEQMLPHSRAEFYKEATDVLLRRLKSAINQYPGPSKKLVLQHLAITGLSRPHSDRDRLTLTYTQVLKEIADILPMVNLDAQHAEPLLKEIVERSGLLLSVDGGERYQFAHLTLQEYLAAAHLEGDPETLLNYHRRDPGTWREPVKLWCGNTSKDSRPVIAAVYDRDPVLAFECLADAQHVDPDLAESITHRFERQLDVVLGAERQVVIGALGAVASDRRPRGRAVFAHLERVLRDPGDSRWNGAVQALASTNLPEAVTVLTEALVREQGETPRHPAPAAGSVPPFDPHVRTLRDALISMGDIAIPALEERARQGIPGALSDIAAIGTPSALQALIGLAYDEGGQALRAGWYLATMLGTAEFDEALAAERSARTGSNGGSWHWVWDPFRAGSSPAANRVVDRVVQLINDRSAGQPPGDLGDVDARLAIPLAATALSRIFTTLPEIDAGTRRMITELPVMLRPRAHVVAPPPSARAREYHDILHDCLLPRDEIADSDRRLDAIATRLLSLDWYLLRSLQKNTAEELLLRARDTPSRLTRGHWQQIFVSPAVNQAKARRARRASQALLIALCATGLVTGLAGVFGLFDFGFYWISLLGGAVVAVSRGVPWLGRRRRQRRTADLPPIVGRAACALMMLGLAAATVALGGLVVAALLAIGLALLYLSLTIRAGSLLSGNLMRDLLEMELQASLDSTSVIGR
ncbi:NACHT domain-containing protein [Spongiactinospora sp. TRM90649]|uniref:NACHT domain-containing protein n=1 Tax=Spongiactinospora sp. TRM90649 TaxID=3031114 RepID=UPI0023F817C2|nr:NACHT domain-containing protein [Spongiactinospora sp. TRM90649]MDF5751923.1 NACHT domain-containing protein [Spongiactinospora sp. TRM90649]